MITRDEILTSGRTLFDSLVHQLDFFGNESIARIVTLALLLGAAMLGLLLVRGAWRFSYSIFSRNREAPKLANVAAVGVPAPTSIATTPSSRATIQTSPSKAKKDANNASVSKSIETLSGELQGFRTILGAMVDRLAEDSRERMDQSLKFHTETAKVLTKIDASMSGLILKINKDRAQAVTIETRIESLRASIADLAERLTATDRQNEHGNRPKINAQPEKFSAEIADIVRELQEA